MYARVSKSGRASHSKPHLFSWCALQTNVTRVVRVYDLEQYALTLGLCLWKAAYGISEKMR